MPLILYPPKGTAASNWFQVFTHTVPDCSPLQPTTLVSGQACFPALVLIHFAFLSVEQLSVGESNML